MARLPGKASALQVAGADVVGVKNISLKYSGDAVDVTGMDSSGLRVFIAGLTSWGISASGVWDTGETKFLGATPAIGPGVSAACVFELSQTANNLYSGTGIITDFSSSSSVDGSVEWSIEIQGSGALTEPTA